MMTDLVFAQAALLAGQLDEQQTELLRLLCQAAAHSLENRLREGITADSCRADFIAAASLCALAALNESGQTGEISEFRAGDVTVKKSHRDVSSRCLQKQAELIIRPYLKDVFLFAGV